jgi:hypothetical protein
MYRPSLKFLRSELPLQGTEVSYWSTIPTKYQISSRHRIISSTKVSSSMESVDKNCLVQVVLCEAQIRGKKVPTGQTPWIYTAIYTASHTVSYTTCGRLYDPDLLMVRGAYCSTHRRYVLTLPFYFSYYSLCCLILLFLIPLPAHASNG